MILIEVRNAQGKLIGRCDAGCYDAVEVDCSCVCGGMNHGRGLQAAKTKLSLRRRRKITRRVKNGRSGIKVVFPDKARQVELAF